jgi:hypothetical protein
LTQTDDVLEEPEPSLIWAAAATVSIGAVLQGDCLAGGGAVVTTWPPSSTERDVTGIAPSFEGACGAAGAAGARGGAGVWYGGGGAGGRGGCGGVVPRSETARKTSIPNTMKGQAIHFFGCGDACRRRDNRA